MTVALWVVIAFTVLVFLRIIVFGSSSWDRLLGTSVIFSKVVVIIIIYASINDTAYLLDFAILYALFGFLGTIFIALFLSDRSKRGKE